MSTTWRSALVAITTIVLLLVGALPAVAEPVPQRQLTVILSGAGTGSVTSSPAGINCPPTCTAMFDEYSVVDLTATPAAGSGFDTFGGDYCAGDACTIQSMYQDFTVTASFELVRVGFTHQLDVTLSGTGTGTVTSSPAGISCPPTCSSTFPEGSIVTLTPSPDTGVEFAGMAGGWCDPCVVKMFFDKAVATKFTLTSATTTKVKMLKYYDRSGQYALYHFGGKVPFRLSVKTAIPLADLGVDSLSGDIAYLDLYRMTGGSWVWRSQWAPSVGSTGTSTWTISRPGKGKYQLIARYPFHYQDGIYVLKGSTSAPAYFKVTA